MVMCVPQCTYYSLQAAIVDSLPGSSSSSGWEGVSCSNKLIRLCAKLNVSNRWVQPQLASLQLIAPSLRAIIRYLAALG